MGKCTSCLSASLYQLHKITCLVVLPALKSAFDCCLCMQGSACWHKTTMLMLIWLTHFHLLMSSGCMSHQCFCSCANECKNTLMGRKPCFCCSPEATSSQEIFWLSTVSSQGGFQPYTDSSAASRACSRRQTHSNVRTPATAERQEETALKLMLLCKSTNACLHQDCFRESRLIMTPGGTDFSLSQTNASNQHAQTSNCAAIF